MHVPLTLITGGTGFIGRRLVAELLRRAVAVRVLARNSPAPASFGSAADVRITGDLAQQESLDGLFEGVGTVMHLAARAHVTADRRDSNAEAYRIANELMTRRLAEASVRNGVRRFVLVSSIKVFGEADPGRPLRFDDPPHPLDAYGRSKWRAEQVLLEVCAGTTTVPVIVRPPLVYGPGVRANFLRMMQLVRRGIPLPLGAVSNRRSLVSTENLVDLLCLCHDHPAAAGATWLVSDDEDLSTPQLLAKVAGAMDCRLRLFSVPLPLLFGLARPLGYAAEISRLTDSLSVDIRETRTVLGWRPPQSVDEGIAKTVRSFLMSHDRSGVDR